MLMEASMMLLVASLSAMPASQTGNHGIAAIIDATSCPLRCAFVNVMMFSHHVANVSNVAWFPFSSGQEC